MYNYLFTALFLFIARKTNLPPVIVQLATLLLLYLSMRIFAVDGDQDFLELINFVFGAFAFILPLAAIFTHGSSWFKPPKRNDDE